MPGQWGKWVPPSTHTRAHARTHASPFQFKAGTRYIEHIWPKISPKPCSEHVLRLQSSVKFREVLLDKTDSEDCISEGHCLMCNVSDIRWFCAHQHQTKRVDTERTGSGSSEIILFSSNLLHGVWASVGYAACWISCKVDEEERKRNVCCFLWVEKKPRTRFQASFTSGVWEDLQGTWHVCCWNFEPFRTYFCSRGCRHNGQSV